MRIPEIDLIGEEQYLTFEDKLITNKKETGDAILQSVFEAYETSDGEEEVTIESTETQCSLNDAMVMIKKLNAFSTNSAPSIFTDVKIEGKLIDLWCEK